jgi:hypothetical protein
MLIQVRIEKKLLLGSDAKTENSSTKKYYTVAETGIGEYMVGKVGAHYENCYVMTNINKNTLAYKQAIDPEYGKYSKTKKAKIMSSTRYYAINIKKCCGKNGFEVSAEKAKYMYTISREEALKCAAESGRMIWMRVKNGKVVSMVINAEKTAG